MAVPLIRWRWTPRLAVAAMLFAMMVFGANFAISRYGIQQGLRPYDIVALRFGVAGVLLLPVFIRLGAVDCAGLGWRKGLMLAMTSGAPIVLLMSFGASLAPAAHGAALAPGTVTVVGVVYAMILAGRLPPWLTRFGLALALGGLLTLAIAGSTTGAPSVALGDLCYFACGLLWGFYPIMLHRWQVGGMIGATICAVLSLVYLPVYFAYLEPRLLQVSAALVLFQAVYQGIANHIVGLWLWGQGVRVLGASGTQLFPPLIPVLGTLTAIPILGEWPSPISTVAIALIVGGIALSAFGNRPRKPSQTDASTGP